jgi:hypothetical protein
MDDLFLLRVRQQAGAEPNDVEELDATPDFAKKQKAKLMAGRSF